jgi:cobalt-zinc-cadmium efflux system outer membrane protein
MSCQEDHLMRAILMVALGVAGWTTVSDGAASAAPLTTLEDAVSRAIDASPLLNARDAAVSAAAGTVEQAGVRPNPTLSIEVENFTGSGPYADLGRTESTLSYSQTLERRSKRRARVALAEAGRTVAERERLAAVAEVALEVQRAWIEFQASAVSVGDAEERLRLAEEMAGVVRRRVEAARDPLAAGFAADNQVADARAALDQAERAFAAARETLGVLTGGDPQPDAAAFAAMSLPLLDGEAPEIAVREARVEYAGRAFAMEKARASQDPTVGVGVRRLEDGNDVAGVVSFSMPLAFFDTNRGNIDRALAEREEAEWLLAEQRRRQAAELRNARAQAEAARAEVAALRDHMIPRAAEAAASASAGYRRGAFDYLMVAEAQAALTALHVRRTVALRRFHEAAAMIDRLTGRWTGAVAPKEF